MMPEPPPADPNPPEPPAEDASVAKRIPFSQTFRATAMLFWGVVVPVFFLGAAASYDQLDDVWQSGSLGDYALLLYTWPSLLFLYPLLIFSAVAMAVLAWSPEKRRQQPWVLAGVAGGALLWLELLVVWAPCVARELHQGAEIMILFFSPIAMVVGVLPWIAMLQVWRVTETVERAVAFSTIAMVVVLAAFTNAIGVLVLYFLGCLVFSAPLSLVVYGWGTVECVRAQSKDRLRISLKALMVALAWFSYHLAAWRWAYESMLKLYAQAPVEQPQNCFVATAAAGGHRRLVGSWEVVARSGKPMRVTRQLQRLKALELALLAASPRTHHAVRAIYNRVGPPLARQLAAPLMADLAYLVLKPCEWATALMLRIACIRPELLDQLYDPEATAKAASADSANTD